MKDTFYLIFTEDGAERIVKNKPGGYGNRSKLKGGEYAAKFTFEVPDSLFDTVMPEVDIEVPEEFVQTVEPDVEVVEPDLGEEEP